MASESSSSGHLHFRSDLTAPCPDHYEFLLTIALKGGLGVADSSKASIPLHLRRVVTGYDAAGAAVVLLDGPTPVASAYEQIPGMMTRLVWATSAEGRIPGRVDDPTSPTLSHLPAAGETRLIVATFPPDSVFAAADFQPELAAAENHRLSPGLADLFEPDGFHRTDSVDYGIVLDGELCLELDNGARTRLQKHDIVVQNGARHAWRNETDRPATVAFVLIGARREE